MTKEEEKEREELGTVYSADGDMVSFNWNKKSGPIRFGELVAIDSPSKRTTFYARVYNRKSGTTVDKETQLREVEGKEDVGPYSKYAEFEAVLFLESCGDLLRTPTQNPDYYDKVYRMVDENYKALKLGNKLQIGRLRSGTRLFGDVGVDPLACIPHMIGIFGKIGCGKTNAELCINGRAASDPTIVSLIFDFAGELLEGKGIGKGLRDHPNFPTHIHHYSFKSEKHKLEIGLKTIYPSDLKSIFPKITVNQLRLAESLFRELKENWITEAVKAYEDAGYKGVKKLVHAPQKSVIDALLLKLFTFKQEGWEDSGYSFINELVSDLSHGVSCLVDVSDITNTNLQRAFTILAGKQAATFWKKMWERNYGYWQKLPTLLITLEEAHEFLQPDRPTFFSQIALKFRKYRVGLLPVTPRPCLLDSDIFAEIHTQIIMKTTMKRDRLFITANTPYLEYSDTEIKMLGKGEALLVADYPEGIPFAVPVKITHYPQFLKEQPPKNYGLAPSKSHEKIDEQIKRIKKAEKKQETLLGNENG